jgi:hypothetical protein
MAPDTADRAAIVDELGALAEQLAPFAHLQLRYDALRAVAAAWFVDADPDAGFTVPGSKYQLDVSARTSERKVTGLRALQKRLGAKAFYAICAVTIKALDTCIPPDEQAAFVSTSQTGPRRIVPAKRTPPS